MIVMGLTDKMDEAILVSEIGINAQSLYDAQLMVNYDFTKLYSYGKQ